MINGNLHQEPKIFTMAHELKHHLYDQGLNLSYCDSSNVREPIEIGAEIFAAELIFPESDFKDCLEKMGVGLQECTPEVLIRLKRKTNTTLSYSSLAKRATFMGFATEGSFAQVKWKKLEEEIYGEPLYKQILRHRNRLKSYVLSSKRVLRSRVISSADTPAPSRASRYFSKTCSGTACVLSIVGDIVISFAFHNTINYEL